MVRDDRNKKGQFEPGNPGGPGRPRRAVEREYLAALSDAVSLSDWREVVAKALADAKSGCPKARNWLTKYLLGDQPPSLLSLAADELDEKTADAEIAEAAKRGRADRILHERLAGLMDI